MVVIVAAIVNVVATAIAETKANCHDCCGGGAEKLKRNFLLSFAADKDDDVDVDDDDDDEDVDGDGDDDVSWAHIERLAVFAPCCCKAASTLRCGLVCLYHVGSLCFVAESCGGAPCPDAVHSARPQTCRVNAARGCSRKPAGNVRGSVLFC